MKIFKFTLTTLLLAVIFFLITGGLESVAPEGRLLKRWLKRRQITEKTGNDAPGVTTRLDVPYINDNDPLHRLDIYFPPKSDKLFPVMIHIHGGGWKAGDKNMMKETGIFYASQGILFVALNYRLSPAVRHPAHIEDCAGAVSWVFDHVSGLAGDKSRIFLSGHSAGAHLAALLGTNSAYLQKYKINPSRLAGVISVDSASYNLLSNDNEMLVKRLVKQAFGSDEKILKEASPFYNVVNKGTYPKFLIFNTTNRKSAVEGGRKFADKLKNRKSNSRFVSVDDHTHRDMATGMYDPSDPVGKTILKFIRNCSAALHLRPIRLSYIAPALCGNRGQTTINKKNGKKIDD